MILDNRVKSQGVSEDFVIYNPMKWTIMEQHILHEA